MSGRTMSRVACCSCRRMLVEGNRVGVMGGSLAAVMEGKCESTRQQLDFSTSPHPTYAKSSSILFISRRCSSKAETVSLNDAVGCCERRC